MIRSKFQFASAALLAAALLAAPPAAAQKLKKARIAVATTILKVTFAWLYLPGPLGYWKDEGLDVEVTPVGASLQVVQQMVGHNAEFGQINSSVIVQGNVVNNIPLRNLMMTKVIDNALAVLDNSPIKSIKDVKGKSIGVFSLASGNIPLLKSYLAANGIDPDKDVSLIPIGLGAPVVDALKTDKVQAVFYWGAANASFENAGLKLRYFSDPKWARVPDFSLVALQSLIDQDPKMAIGVSRAIAKASLFALTNPDCVRKIQWSAYPKTKPTGADDATLAKRDLHSLAAQLKTVKLAYELGGKVWGPGSAADYARMQDFMFDTKQIKKKVDPDILLNHIPNFVKQVNDFDANEVIRRAKACEVK